MVDSIKVYKPVDGIRARVEMYFSSAPAPLYQVVEMIMQDILFAGSFDFQVKYAGPYLMITSSIDWMKSDRAPFEKFFTCCIQGEKGRPHANWIRGEIFVAALSGGYVTNGPQGYAAENMSPDDVPDEVRAATRYLVFDTRSPYLAV